MARSALTSEGLSYLWGKIKGLFTRQKIIDTLGYTPANTTTATKQANGLLFQLPNDNDGNKYLRQDGVWARPKFKDLPAGFFPVHPGTYNGMTFPYIYNDLSFLTKKGGSYTVTYDGVEQNTGSINSDRVFDAGFKQYNVQNPGSTVEEIIFTINTVAAYKWNSKVYVDFGDADFGCASVVVEARQAGTNTWTEFHNVSDLTEPNLVFSANFFSSTGLDGLRFTFSDWTTPASQFCIAQIGLINYASTGVGEVLMPVSGGTMYGPIVPNAYGTMDLGSSSKFWRNVYAKRVTLDADPVEPLEAATKQYVDNNAGGGGGGYPILISSYKTKLEASNWSNNQQTINIPAITATNTVLITPDSDYTGIYVAYGINALSQGDKTLTLSSKIEPIGDIVIDLLVIDVDTLDITDGSTPPPVPSRNGYTITSYKAKLNASAWVNGSQTLTLPAVSATNYVMVAPEVNSQEDYILCKIMASSQLSETLVFTCYDTPSNDVIIDILVIDIDTTNLVA